MAEYKAISIIKEHLLLVEGEDEKEFFDELLKHEQINNIQVFPFGGKDNLTCDEFININLMTSLKSTDLDIRAFSIVLDCDNGNVGDCINKVNTFIQKVNMHKPKGNEAGIITFDKIKSCKQFTSRHTPIALYVMPDCESKGSLETLCIKAVKNENFMTCIENFINCVETQNPNISHKDKRRVLAYLASSSEKCKQVRTGHGIKAGLFDLNSAVFQDVKDFIRQMSTI